MTKAVLAVIALGACLTFAAERGNAAGFECPRISDLATPPLAAEMDNLAPKGLALEQPDELAAAIEFLTDHGLSSDDTINHLIAFYCPAVAAEAGLSDEEKTERVRQFAQQVSSVVLAASSVEDMIFDVPLSPEIAAAAAQQAQQAGMSVEKWIAQVVAAAVR